MPGAVTAAESRIRWCSTTRSPRWCAVAAVIAMTNPSGSRRSSLTPGLPPCAELERRQMTRARREVAYVGVSPRHPLPLPAHAPDPAPHNARALSLPICGLDKTYSQLGHAAAPPACSSSAISSATAAGRPRSCTVPSAAGHDRRRRGRTRRDRPGRRSLPAPDAVPRCDGAGHARSRRVRDLPRQG